MEDQRCLDWVITADATSAEEASNKKQRRRSRLSDTEMSVLQLLLVVLLAVPHVFADTPTYVDGRWTTEVKNPDDNLDDAYDGNEDDSPSLQENMFPVNSTGTAGPQTVVVQVLQTTPESHLLLGEDRSEVHDSKVWKIVLVTVILLMSLVGCLGTAYYLCIWRGGRIHYQPQRVYA